MADSEAENREKAIAARVAEAAARALAEAAARRAAAPVAPPAAKEIGGRDGPDPVRFGDWEVGGKATDF